MNRFEYEDALNDIAILERRRARLLVRAEDVPDRAWREKFYQWADTAGVEIGKRKDDIWDAIVRGDVRGELPL